jgi:hypothetical protein
MKKLNKIILAMVALFLVISVTAWFVNRPKRITEEFVGHLSHERYEEAAQMLQAPSDIKVVSVGDMVLVDRTGNSTTVPVERLPFFVGGGEPDGPGHFAMTALQNRTKGDLNRPAVIVYLSIENGKVHIERVDAS